LIVVVLAAAGLTGQTIYGFTVNRPDCRCGLLVAVPAVIIVASFMLSGREHSLKKKK
jgi:hypothetical protein